MTKPRFSLKTLVFAVTLAAVLLGWWVDHRRLARHIADLTARHESVFHYAGESAQQYVRRMVGAASADD
jgi:uncharacterized membrane-anchored protein